MAEGPPGTISKFKPRQKNTNKKTCGRQTDFCQNALSPPHEQQSGANLVTIDTIYYCALHSRLQYSVIRLPHKHEYTHADRTALLRRPLGYPTLVYILLLHYYCTVQLYYCTVQLYQHDGSKNLKNTRKETHHVLAQKKRKPHKPHTSPTPRRT